MTVDRWSDAYERRVRFVQLVAGDHEGQPCEDPDCDGTMSVEPARTGVRVFCEECGGGWTVEPREKPLDPRGV